MTGAHLFLVSYDIACPRRWRRVVRILARTGQRQQLSVFFCRATPARMAGIEKAMKRAMNDGEDRLLIVDLGPAGGAAMRFRSSNAIAAIADLGALIV